MQNDELLPCPFCGGEAEEATAKMPTGECYLWVQCRDCGAMSECCNSSDRHNNPDEPDPIVLWNTRTAHSGEGREDVDYWNEIAQRLGHESVCEALEKLAELQDAGEGRSNGAGEVDPSKMSVEMADLFGLVCKLNRLKTERDDLMRTDGGFSVIERAADMMDEIVDAMPALQSAFNKVCERERLLLAALAQPEAGGDR